MENENLMYEVTIGEEKYIFEYGAEALNFARTALLKSVGDCGNIYIELYKERRKSSETE